MFKDSALLRSNQRVLASKNCNRFIREEDRISDLQSTIDAALYFLNEGLMEDAKEILKEKSSIREK